MNVKVSHLLASFIAVFLIAFSAQAQEEVNEIPDPSRREFSLEDDKTLLFDHNIHSAKDSLQSAPKVNSLQPVKYSKPDAHKGNAKEEEDALSFNFLYYIIQKFKMTDLVD